MPPKTTKPAAPAGQSYAEEQKAAAALVRGNPNAPPLQQQQPPVTPAPIKVETITEPPADEAFPPRDVLAMPRLRKVVFRDSFAFDNASFTVKEVDLSSEFYRGVYKRMEFGLFMGRLHVLIERKSGDKFVCYRIPFEAIVAFATFEDNPKGLASDIVVNGQSKPAQTANG